MTLLPLPQSGDVVAILSPSSPNDALDYQDIAANSLLFGFEPRLMPHLNEDRGFLAGPDDHRASDFNDALRDPEVRAILPTRGGYGAGRILPLLDYKALAQDPIPLLGFSDITALHMAFWKHGLPSLHGPNFGGRLGEYSLEMLQRAMDPAPIGTLDSPSGKSPVVLHSGQASGPLVGGNLAVFCSLVGTPWVPPTDGAILFFEDVNESAYRVDRLLTQLRLAGILDRAAGIAFGQFTETGTDKTPLIEVLAERTHGLGLPVLANLPFGHVRENATLPHGARAEISDRLIITESIFQKPR